MSTAPASLSFGIVAPSGSSDVGSRFEELAKLLSVAPKTFASYKELAASVRGGSTDIAWLGPVSYAWIAEGVTPIGTLRRQGQTDYHAALMVLEGSKLRTFDDLKKAKGLRAGWVDPWSAAGYVIPRIELARAGVLPADVFAKETFFGTHARALDALVAGDVDVIATYAKAARDGVSLHPLKAWGPIPSDVVAVRRNLGPREYDAAREALRAAFADETRRAHVKAVFGADELEEGIGEGHQKLRLAYESAVASGLFD